MVWALACGRTDSYVTTKIFEIDRLPIFSRYGAPLARLRRAGAPLLSLLSFSLYYFLGFLEFKGNFVRGQND